MPGPVVPGLCRPRVHNGSALVLTGTGPGSPGPTVRYTLQPGTHTAPHARRAPHTLLSPGLATWLPCFGTRRSSLGGRRPPLGGQETLPDRPARSPQLPETTTRPCTESEGFWPIWTSKRGSSGPSQTPSQWVLNGLKWPFLLLFLGPRSSDLTLKRCQKYLILVVF